MSEVRASAEGPASRSARDVLLRTKLYRRAAPPGLVPRPRLVEALDRGLSSRLTLVSAPAGFGKTTVLSEWLGRCPCAVGWVSLDPTDDDPTTFLRYVVAALQDLAPEVGRTADALFREPQLPPVEAILTILLNDLSTLTRDLVLVLEDYHSIASPAIHRGVAYLLDHMPTSAHLVIATRADPPLPLARLRSRGELVEVRADDLRFDPGEAWALVERASGVRLTAEESAALQARTEGWAAGLQLAALSLRGRQDVARFVEDFAGSHRYVADYLLEEVLGRQPEGAQSFLLRTSILDRISGPLADAVTGGSDGQVMLERLERENLFLVPLDDDRRWYRYHHLFADLLRSRLQRSDGAAVADLHGRAARWLDGEGFAREAVSHALAATDYELAALLVVKHWLPVAAEGETAAAHRWISSLPDGAVRAHPWLAFAAAWLCYLQGRFDEVESYLDDAGRALAQSDDEAAERGGIPRGGLVASIPALRSYLAAQRGEVTRALALAQESLDASSGRALSQGHSLGAMAAALEEQPDSARAVEAFERSLPLFRESRNSLAVTLHAYPLVRLLIQRGELARAEGTCREVLRLAEDGGMIGLPSFGVIHTALADVLLERGELDSAEEELRHEQKASRGAGSFEILKVRHVALARLRLARGDLRGCLDAFERAADLVGGSGAPLAVAEVAARQATALLRAGDLDAASAWAERAAARGGEDRGYVRDLESLGIARVLVASGREAEAVSALDQLAAAAEEDGRAGTLIETLVLRSMGHRAQRQHEQTMADLRRALEFARREGQVRALLDGGPEVVNLLRRGVGERRWEPSLVEYAGKLIAASTPAEPAPMPPVHPSAAPSRRQSSQPLVEPLSPRELEVLGLLAEGLTNEQIAVRLIIALGTVKAHVHNISGKLGAQNRANAVARAKELGLL